MKGTTAPSRREQLLAAARAVLAEKGFEAATVSEIVAKAGVAQGTFYLYFPSKASLALELFREMHAGIFTEVKQALDEADGFDEALEAGVAAVFRATASYHDVLDTITSRTALLNSLTELERFDEPYYHLMTDLIEQGQLAGQVDPVVQPELAARLIVGLVERATEDCFIYRPGIATEPYIAEITRFVRKALVKPSSS